MIPSCPKVHAGKNTEASTSNTSVTPNLGLYSQTLFSTLGINPENTFVVTEIVTEEEEVESNGEMGNMENFLSLSRVLSKKDVEFRA